jgi:chromosome segregation ATPase
MEKIKKFMKEFLGIDEIQSQVDDLEQRLGDVEIQVIQTNATINQMKTTLNQFGNFKNQTPEVLRFMEEQIQDLLSSVVALIEGAECDDILEEAKALHKRLKNNETRIHNAQRALEAGG